MPIPPPTPPRKPLSVVHQKLLPYRKSAVWLSIAVACVGGFEGLRQAAYVDPVGIPTICFGETRGVVIGNTKTKDECRALLASRLLEFDAMFRQCATPVVADRLQPAQYAAYVSFLYNVGPGKHRVKDGFCVLKGKKDSQGVWSQPRESTMLRQLKEGNVLASCNEFPKWATGIGGIPLRGLTLRRAEERRMCLSGTEFTYSLGVGG